MLLARTPALPHALVKDIRADMSAEEATRCVLQYLGSLDKKWKPLWSRFEGKARSWLARPRS